MLTISSAFINIKKSYAKIPGYSQIQTFFTIFVKNTSVRIDIGTFKAIFRSYKQNVKDE